MGKRRRESDSDEAIAAKLEFNTVFIDTSLDTHLAMLVSSSDTVSDFKKKIILEHMQFFPAVGEIKIKALKVKRRSNFYYLPEVMLVWNALQGLKGNWYLSVDATSGRVDGKDADKFGGLSSDEARMKNEVSEIVPLVNLDRPLAKTSDTCSEGNGVETEHNVNKKRKLSHTTEAHVASEMEHRPGQDVPKASKGVTSVGNKRKKKEQSKLAVEIHSKIDLEHTGRIENTNCCSEARESKEEEGNKCLPLSQEVEVTTLSNKNSFGNAVPDLMQKENLSLPVRPEGANCSQNKKKTKNKNRRMEKGEKSTDVNHKNSDIKQAANGTSASLGLICPSIDNITEATDEEESTLKVQDARMKLLDGSCNDANENIEAADGKGADVVITAQTTQALEGTASGEKAIKKIQNCLVNGHGESVQVDQGCKNIEDKGSKAKKKRKKIKLDPLDVKMKDADTVEAIPVAMPEDADKKSSVSSDVKNDQLNIEGAAENIHLDSEKKIEDTKPAKLMTRKVESNPDQDVPTESWGVGSNEVPDHDARLTDNSGAVEDVSSKSSRKKKRKSHKIAAEFKDNSGNKTHKPEENEADKSSHVNLDHEVTISSVKNTPGSAAPNTEKNVSTVAHTAEVPDISSGSKKKSGKKIVGNSTVANPEEAGIEQTVNNNEECGLHHKGEDVQIESLDCPSKDASEKFQHADENEANLVVSTHNSQMAEDAGAVEKIVENAVTCGNTVNEDKISKKKKKKVQVALEDSENLPAAIQKVGNEASAATGNNLVDVVTSKIKKVDDNCVLSAYPKERDVSLEKPVKILDKKRKKRAHQGVNAVKKMVTKTPQNKSLFIKPGSIFEDDSGESSDDENGTLYTTSRTVIPAHSSSESSDSESESESELCQGTTGNGPIDSKEPSTGGGRSAVEATEVTMDMILRRSKLFKKAKLVAAQNERWGMEEYVAESQLI